MPDTHPRPMATSLAMKAQPATQALRQLANDTGLYLLCPSALADRTISYTTTNTAPLTALRALLHQQQYQLTLTGAIGNLTPAK